MWWVRVCLSAFTIMVTTEQSASTEAYLQNTSIEDFARNPSIYNYSISPDGEKLLYHQESQGGRFIIVSTIENTGLVPATRIAIPGDIYDTGTLWVSKDKLFGYEVRYHGELPLLEEEPHITTWIMNADGSDKKTLWKETPSIRKKKPKKGRKRKPSHKVIFNLLHTLPNNPDHVLVSRIEVTPEKQDDTELDVVSDIFQMNINTGEMKLVTPDHGIKGAKMFSWIPDHIGIIRMGYGEAGKEEEPILLVRKDADSEWTRLHDNDLFKRGKFYPIAFSADPDILYVSSSLATGRDVFYRFSIKRGRLKGKVFGHPDVDAHGLFLSKDRSKVVAVSYYDDEYRMDILDDEFQERMAKVARAVGNDNFILGDTDERDSRQIVWVGDERSIQKPWLYFEDLGQAIALPDPAPWNRPETMASTKSVRYRARDGLEIPAYLTLPTTTKSRKNLPAILMPHGGPYVRDYKTWDFWVQFLASRGYAVLQPNFRGSTGYGDRFTAMGYGEWGGDMQQDIADGATWLIDQEIADPERLCILGGSYGGYAALMGLIQDSHIFRCGIAWAPVTDLKKILIQDNAWDKDNPWFWRVTGGRSHKELKELSPAYLAGKITRPLLLMHGDQDDIVFVDQSRILVKALEKSKNSTPLRYLEFAGLGHQIETYEARLNFLKEVERFLFKHNPPDEWTHTKNVKNNEAK